MNTEPRRSLAVDHGVADIIPFQPQTQSLGLAVENMGQAMELAKLMASGKLGVPAHLHNEPVACLRVVMLGQRTALDPFWLAEESHVISRKLGFSAKATYAASLQSGRINGRLDFSFKGDGENLECTVRGRAVGSDVVHERTVKMKGLTTRNSPLWKTDPQQQLGYYAARAWCRLYAPDAMMGMKTPDELAFERSGYVDVTPAAEQTSETAVAARLGMDRDREGEGDAFGLKPLPEDAETGAPDESLEEGKQDGWSEGAFVDRLAADLRNQTNQEALQTAWAAENEGINRCGEAAYETLNNVYNECLGNLT